MHRVGQLVGHLTARVSQTEVEALHGVLPPAGWQVFEAMPVADRRHALDVVRHLLDRGHDDPELLAAALLHDAGKGRRLRLWHRIGGVMLGAVAPRALARLASSDEGSRRYPWYVYLNHAALSGIQAERAGCPPRTAALIAGRIDAGHAADLAALHAADEAN